MSSIFTVGDVNFEVCVLSSEKEFLDYLKATKTKTEWSWLPDKAAGATTDLGYSKGVRRVVLSLDLSKKSTTAWIASTAAHEATHILGMIRDRMNCEESIGEWDCYCVDRIVLKTMEYALKKLKRGL